ncbi:MAG: hypothetical protein HKO13_03875 [Sphingomonas sp.]|nr:hypothetical protein [Sphingomonas sp.]
MNMLANIMALAFATPQSEAEPLDHEEYLEAIFSAKPGYRQTVDRIDAEAMATGPIQSDWKSSGISVENAFSAAGADLNSHAKGNWRQGGRGLQIFDATVPEADRFDYRYTYQAPTTSKRPNQHQFYRVGEGVFMHSWGNAEKVGQQTCWSDAGGEVLSTSPKSEWSDELTFLVMWAANFGTKFRDEVYCLSFQNDEEQLFEQYFDEEGRPYTDYSATGYTIEIVPRDLAFDEYFGGS